MRLLDVKNKTKYFRSYSKYAFSLLKPGFVYRSELSGILKSINRHDEATVSERVNYYNKLIQPFHLDKPVSMTSLNHKRHSQMKIDLDRATRYFDRHLCFNYVFGDVTQIPPYPSFLKSRPIEGDNQNSVLLKLNSIRHFNFVNDPIPFIKKKNLAVWRGSLNRQPMRKKLVELFNNHPKCDIGYYNSANRCKPYHKNYLSLSEQLQNKFIICVEGHDVATSTKWIMSSNSLCFMPKPKYETWFMEGRLKANFHYVLLKDDFSDLEEKMDYYSSKTDEALSIVENAQNHVKQFKHFSRERLISLLVAKKYFDLCQNNSTDPIILHHPAPQVGLSEA